MIKDRPIIGFLLGLLFTVIGFFLVFLIQRDGNTFSYFLDFLKNNHRALSTALTLSILANLIPFLYFQKTHRNEALRGTVTATMLVAVFILLLRFVWT